MNTYKAESEKDLLRVLREIRINKKITQEQIGVKTSISRFECGVHSPTMRTVMDYVNKLGCKLEIVLKDNKES